jgi:LysM repeat protein
MKKIGVILLSVLLAILFAGCEFDATASRSKKASTNADITSLQNDVKRLQTDLDLLKEQMDRFTQEQQDSLAAVRTAAAKLEDEATSLRANVGKDISAVESKFNKQIKDIDAKIDGALREVMAILGKIKTTGATGGSRSGSTEKGFYHTVEEKESPWSIAQKYKDEYGVTAQDILDANGLKSGDSIQVGQKLFIPAKK